MSSPESNSDYPTMQDCKNKFLYSEGEYNEVCAQRDRAIFELKRLTDLINRPHTHDFLEAVKIEAAHQKERFGLPHDQAKMPQDWFWTLGYLSGKALHSAMLHDYEKCKHHIITSAALLLNWFHMLNEKHD